jgi:glucan biosynthesis protein
MLTLSRLATKFTINSSQGSREVTVTNVAKKQKQRGILVTLGTARNQPIEARLLLRAGDRPLSETWLAQLHARP